MGIVAEKSVFNYSLFSSTRLNIIYKMSEIIAEGVSNFILYTLGAGISAAQDNFGGAR